ncbi:MAG: hypothetical protein ACMUJM_05885 [bacterium]
MYFGCVRKKRIFLVIFFMICSVTLVGTAGAYGPKITDVTTKGFSVLWTASAGSTPGIIIYTSNAYSTSYTSAQLASQGIEIAVESSSEAQNFGVMKVAVSGLNINTTYYFCPTINGSPIIFKRQVTTEKLYGLYGGAEDIGKDFPANDIVHTSVYKTDGTSAALGAYVVAEIVDNNGTPKTDSPISAAVGDGMPQVYKQYAAVNMNNFFDTGHFPLSVKANGSENIQFTIVRGTQNVADQNDAEDYFVQSPIRINQVTKIGEEKISVPMIAENFYFEKGLNMFSLPCNVGPYASDQLFDNLKSKDGDVIAIYGYNEAWPSKWKITKPGRRGYDGAFDIIIGDGTGCIVQMRENMPTTVGFYGTLESSTINFIPNSLTLVSLPQAAVAYESKDIFEDLINKGANVVAIYGYSEAWPSKWKITKPGRRGYSDSFPIIPGNACIVQIKEINNQTNRIDNWNPIN